MKNRTAFPSPTAQVPPPSQAHVFKILITEKPTMPRIIEVTVSPLGVATVQTRGYTGGDCLQASKFLEHALGVTATDHKTAEFYQGQQTEQTLPQAQ